MEFIHKIIFVYNLYKSGELDSLIEDFNQANFQKYKIDSMLKGLEADVKASKQRLGQAQDAVMRKSLNLNTDVDCAVQLGSVVVFI